MNYQKTIETAIDSRRSPDERLANVSKAFEELAEQSNASAARKILAQLEGIDVEAVDEKRAKVMTEAVQRLTSGDWTDLAGVSAGAFLGVFAGRYAHKVLDFNPKGIPVVGLLGAGASTAASLMLMKNMRVGPRATVAAAGAGLLAGNLIRLNDLEG